MFKDKNRDIARAILPSCARKWARFQGRHIARIRRRAVREALNNVGPESEWCEGDAFARLGKREAKARSMECWRVSERRDADKLGSLKRWTLHHKRTSDNDEEAYQKVCEVLKPGQNLITRHAVGHAEAWLDLTKDQYRYSYRAVRPTPELLTGRELLQVLNSLFEIQHAKLNKCFKNLDEDLSGRGGYLTSRICKDDSPCSTKYTYTDAYHELYDPSLKRWVAYDPKRLPFTTARTRVRKVERHYPRHDGTKCPNVVLIKCREDIEKACGALQPWGGITKNTVKAKDKKGQALRRVLELANRMDLLPYRMEGMYEKAPNGQTNSS